MNPKYQSNRMNHSLTHDDYHEIMEKWLMVNQPKTILVMGDIMLDRYWFGNTKRISPEAPVPVVNIQKQEDRLGGAANVAVNLCTIGDHANLIGIIGTDHDGKMIKTICKEKGIFFNLIEDSLRPTISKLRVIGQHQHMLRCDFEKVDFEKNDDYQSIMKQLETTALINIEKSDVILFSDYAKGSLDEIQTLIRHAKQLNKPIIIDPKGNSFDKYKGATVITPNRSEFETIVGKCTTEEIFLERAENLRNSLELEAIIVTRSEQGVTLIEKNKPPITYKAQAKDIFDVTGAGDTVISLIASGIAHHLTLSKSLYIANIGASIVIGKLGASSVTKEELISGLNAYEKLSESDMEKRNILSKEEVKKEIEMAKQKGETIVMTNGCFDLLHKGHLTYLKKAKALGDRLVIALNSDRLIKKIKGEERPIMDESSRALLISSLSFVDWVVIFDSDTPKELIEYLLPDILVKGSDYQIGDIAGAKEVISNGGRVQLIDFVEGHSSSQIISKIKNKSIS